MIRVNRKEVTFKEPKKELKEKRSTGEAFQLYLDSALGKIRRKDNEKRR